LLCFSATGSREKDGEEQGAASGQDPSQPADVHTQAQSAQGLGMTVKPRIRKEKIFIFAFTRKFACENM
jgi:hypothetical protein